MSLHLPAVTASLTSRATGAPTMSSRDIAEICGARHNDVVETIERLFATGVLRESRKTTRQHRPEGGGRPTAVYDLTKRDTLVVVSGYNADVRAKIIDRWMELEAGSPRLPANYSAALRELAAAVETIEVQEALIGTMAPKAVALDLLADTDGMILISDAAKQLQMPIKDLFAWLRTHRWIFRRGGSKRDIGYADKIAASLLVHKYHPVRQDDGSEVLKEQVHLTPKGLTHLALKFGRDIRAISTRGKQT
ncbi:Phage regulatory protein Rha (Phage_pRha) [Tardiphaga sp. OK246]|uniref:phage regulatory protein/antirepressor Ant n=1 Tax=Tardiphaga sp. OK246 TaxID=1855307 RepID=UPI000B684484|nr:phage regulatory protein/antirepressor Ant [Tardiphaga sp. OK246]SNS36757.1 Phage regulatory protein Rha (Phage_pRha) [Tardiphaga sp. OK246]